MENTDPHYTEFIDERHKDFSYNWVSSSRFIWLATLLGFLVFTGGCACQLYKHRYKGKPEVVVPENTLYNPKYK